MLVFPNANTSLLATLAESALLSPPCYPFTSFPFLWASGPPGATSHAVLPSHNAKNKGK